MNIMASIVLSFLALLISITITAFTCQPLSLWRKLEDTFDDEEAADNESSQLAEAYVNQADVDIGITEITRWFQKLEEGMKAKGILSQKSKVNFLEANMPESMRNVCNWDKLKNEQLVSARKPYKMLKDKIIELYRPMSYIDHDSSIWGCFTNIGCWVRLRTGNNHFPG